MVQAEPEPFFIICLYNSLVDSLEESSLNLIQCCFQHGVLVNWEGSKTRTFNALPPIPTTFMRVLFTLYSPLRDLLFLIFSTTLSIVTPHFFRLKNYKEEIWISSISLLKAMKSSIASISPVIGLTIFLKQNAMLEALTEASKIFEYIIHYTVHGFIVVC